VACTLFILDGLAWIYLKVPFTFISVKLAANWNAMNEVIKTFGILCTHRVCKVSTFKGYCEQHFS